MEHCPPRALFDGKHAPAGFEFAACDDCNGGTSDEDLLVAFLSHMDPLEDASFENPARGLFFAVKRQAPEVLGAMRVTSAVEARRGARALGIKPKPGETYMELPLVKVPEELHRAVKTFAGKLTKALFFMQTNQVFPVDGGILFHWFTNASALPTGSTPPILEVFAPLAFTEPPLKRNGKDLSDQLGLRVSFGEEDTLQVVQATFRRSFGFLCIACTRPGQVDMFMAEAIRRSGSESRPFEKL